MVKEGKAIFRKSGCAEAVLGSINHHLQKVIPASLNAVPEQFTGKIHIELHFSQGTLGKKTCKIEQTI